MSRDPKGEDISQIFPHVAAVAAAYGDPTGKYGTFLGQHVSNYKTKVYWFNNQPSALSYAPTTTTTTTTKSRRKSWMKREDGFESVKEMIDVPSSTIRFECPAIFDDLEKVEIDDGIFVTCEELKPLYLEG